MFSGRRQKAEGRLPYKERAVGEGVERRGRWKSMEEGGGKSLERKKAF